MARARHEVRRAPARMSPRRRAAAEFPHPEVVSDDFGPMGTRTTATAWNIVLGIWLIVSPWFLGYGGLAAATWDAVVVGAGIAVIAIIRTARPEQTRPLGWLNVLLGLWLIISPWVVSVNHARPAPYWNDVIIGIAVAVLAWIATSTPAGRGEARV